MTAMIIFGVCNVISLAWKQIYQINKLNLSSTLNSGFPQVPTYTRGGRKSRRGCVTFCVNVPLRPLLPAALYNALIKAPRLVFRPLPARSLAPSPSSSASFNAKHIAQQQTACSACLMMALLGDGVLAIYPARSIFQTNIPSY